MRINKENMDVVGNVLMNYNYYSGQDYYSEGISEDILLDYVQRYSEEEYDQIIQEARSWSVLYHLSHVRENIVSFLPINKNDKVLEIGAGCGAVTGALARLAGKVTCIELSKKRSLINANRHKNMDNIEIVVGNFQDIEPEIEEEYDYITLIGVLEYAESYIGHEDPYHEFLSRISKHLKPNGKLIIAIENKYGLKYFAGCKEDHTGRFFEGIEGYTNSSGVRTFSRNVLDKLVKDTGLTGKFYYPYPDYKLCHAIYSDEYQPKTGELNNNLRNFDDNRIICFDENKAFETIASDKMFPIYSNSFLVVASKNDLQGENTPDEEYPIYVKYSDERRSEYRIATIITGSKDGRRVYKNGITSPARFHVEDVCNHGIMLDNLYEGSVFKANKCSMHSEGSVQLEYLKGITMEQYLDKLEEQGEYDKMLALIRKFTFEVYKLCKSEFEPSEGFVTVFSNLYNGKDKAMDVSDIDMIFTNIVFDEEELENGTWNILDYEWTYSFKVPMKFILYRSIFYYMRERMDRGFAEYLNMRGINLYKETGISEEEAEYIFPKMENHFQVFLKGNTASLDIVKKMIGTSEISVDNAVKEALSYGNLACPQVYYGSGLGFKPDAQLCIIGQVSDERSVTVEIPLDDDVTEIRIDPTEYPCIVKVDSIELISDGNETEKLDRFMVNGYIISSQSVFYDHNDAQIVIDKLKMAYRRVLRVKYTVSKADSSVYDDMRTLLIEKTERENKEKELTFMDKVLVKMKKWTPEVVPEGYRYNYELEEE